MKLYKIIALWIDLFIISFGLAIFAEIVTLFIPKDELLNSPIIFIFLIIIITPITIYLWRKFKNDNTIGLKLSKKLFKKI